jgi:hypothetical protein
MALEQPKKPAGGGYGFFLAEKRPEFTKACAGKPASEISKLAGQAWKAFSDAQKKPYEEKYAVAKAKYEKDIAAFLAAGGEKTKGVAGLRAEKRKAKEGKKAKDPNAPKRPAGGGYGAFLAENREAIRAGLPKGHAIFEVTKVAGVRWKALPDAAKKPYEAKFQKNMEEFKKAMEQYKAAHPDAEESDEDEDEEGEANVQKKAKTGKDDGSAKKVSKVEDKPAKKGIAKAKVAGA